MENQADSKNIIINYGLISGGAAIAVAVITYAMGKTLDPGLILTILSFFLPIAVMVLGIKKYKEINHGFLAWGQAVKIGIGIALIWGALALSFQYILENIVDPDLLVQKIDFLREKLEDWGLDDDMIDEQIEKQENQNPLLGNAIGLLVFTFVGFVVSAIAGAVMKKTEEDQY